MCVCVCACVCVRARTHTRTLCSSQHLMSSVKQVLKLQQLEREGSFSNGLCVGEK